MASKLKVLSGDDIVDILGQFGFEVFNQKGSHIHLRHPTKPPLTVPNHGEIAKGTLKAIIQVSGLKPEDFI